MIPPDLSERLHVLCEHVWEEHRLSLVLSGVGIVCLFVATALLYKSIYTAEPIQFSEEAVPVSAHSNETLIIDVSGAVNEPGVYELEVKSRVQDAVETAGGFHSNADSAYIAKHMNRASELTDGMKLYIPFKGEQPENGRETALGVKTEGISINTASQSELETLPGIGSKTAQKIIDNRPYSSIDELLHTGVVFQSTFETIKDDVSL